ncbi:MAG: hypothetical protein V9H69_24400 [Anaerolineae bacterium]
MPKWAWTTTLSATGRPLAADSRFEIGHPLGVQLQAEIDAWRLQLKT